MNAPHTPGPWKILVPDGSMIVANGHHIASVAMGGPIDGPEDRANARLIAAAPDLLAALKEAADFVQPFNRASDLLDRIDAAIASATGGQS